MREARDVHLVGSECLIDLQLRGRMLIRAQENCYFFCSLIQEGLLADSARVVFGALHYQNLAPDARLRVDDAKWKRKLAKKKADEREIVRKILRYLSLSVLDAFLLGSGVFGGIHRSSPP